MAWFGERARGCNPASKNTVFIGKVGSEGLHFMQNIIIHRGNQNCACMVQG